MYITEEIVKEILDKKMTEKEIAVFLGKLNAAERLEKTIKDVTVRAMNGNMQLEDLAFMASLFFKQKYKNIPDYLEGIFDLEVMNSAFTAMDANIKYSLQTPAPKEKTLNKSEERSSNEELFKKIQVILDRKH